MNYQAYEDAAFSSRRRRILILALLSIILALTLIVTGTYALFTDAGVIPNHFTTGTLKASLIRTSHSYSALDAKGYLKEVKVTTENVDMTDKMENAFDIPTGTLLVPGSKIDATFSVSNADTVAFDYTVELIAVDKNGVKLKAGANVLLGQLKVTLEDAAGAKTVMGTSETSVKITGKKTIEVGAKESFKVSIEFQDLDKDGSVNNAAQNTDVYLDLVVSAVQHTTPVN